MTTRQLYYLVTISDSGSLSHAAQVLGISQPALSKFLTDYEESLGFHLFLRYHKKLTPTSVGRYVIECAQKLLDEQTRMLQTMRAVTDSNHVRIRLATAPNRAAILYSRIYNHFAHRYPDISLTLTEIYASSQPGAILHGQVDLAIGAGRDSDKVTDLPFACEELLVSLPASPSPGPGGPGAAFRPEGYALCPPGPQAQHPDSGGGAVRPGRFQPGGCL